MGQGASIGKGGSNKEYHSFYCSDGVSLVGADVTLGAGVSIDENSMLAENIDSNIAGGK
ncbi:MAG: hypothetical protein RRY18_00195 [Clostridia bacterium]